MTTIRKGDAERFYRFTVNTFKLHNQLLRQLQQHRAEDLEQSRQRLGVIETYANESESWKSRLHDLDRAISEFKKKADEVEERVEAIEKSSVESEPLSGTRTRSARLFPKDLSEPH